MIRSNVGNIVTNGQQIISVGAFTAGGLKRSLGKADTALNNLSKEERQNYVKMQADKMRDEMNAYNSGGASATQHLSKEELTQYRQAQADDMRRKIEKNKDSDVESVDEIMGGISIDDSGSPPNLQENSEQVSELNLRMQRDREWFKSWYDTRIKGKSRISNITKSKFLKHMRGEDSDANV